MERKNAWKTYSEEEMTNLTNVCEGYKAFLDNGKTERECVAYSVNLAEKFGYKPIEEYIRNFNATGVGPKAGDKIYAVHMGKTVAMFQLGKESLAEGMNILGAHIDSPRIDVKQNPLYENTDFAYLDTHYYGGIKKYQWVALPLAIHGVVAKTDGTVVAVNIGDEEGDPVFCITDLLIHLAQEQLEKRGAKVVEGENLDLLIGSMPLAGEEKEAVKKNVLKLLKDKYDIEEEDFMSAELEIVPQGTAKDCGIDRSMVMAYGQDDRVCAYTSLAAMLRVSSDGNEEFDKTRCLLLVDKEEIGSVGATGMQSKFFENTVAELVAMEKGSNALTLRRCLSNSSMLSSDVSAGYDPLYASAFEKKNAAIFGRGMVFNKFTGSRGKSGSNDANAEYIARIRGILEKNDVCYQTSELGKVDIGGGGTIAYILSLYGMEVIDCGIAVLNMHAPWEVTSKADIYETEKGYEAFLREA